MSRGTLWTNVKILSNDVSSVSQKLVLIISNDIHTSEKRHQLQTMSRVSLQKPETQGDKIPCEENLAPPRDLVLNLNSVDKNLSQILMF